MKYQPKIYWDSEFGYTVQMVDEMGCTRVDCIGSHPTDMIVALKDAQNKLKEHTVTVFLSSTPTRS